MPKKKKSGINVAKSRQHHNVNGEEPDPQLDFLFPFIKSNKMRKDCRKMVAIVMTEQWT